MYRQVFKEKVIEEVTVEKRHIFATRTFAFTFYYSEKYKISFLGIFVE
jgi:hypothetical protein